MKGKHMMDKKDADDMMKKRMPPAKKPQKSKKGK